MDLPPIDSLPNRAGRDEDVENGLDLATVATLLLAVSLSTAGQLLLKAGMTEIGEITSVGPGQLLGLVGSVLTTWKALLGLASFAVSSLFWLVALSRIPLSTAYPFVALSYVIILGFSTLVLHERPPLLTWGGAGLIVTGIVLIGFGGFERGT